MTPLPLTHHKDSAAPYDQTLAPLSGCTTVGRRTVSLRLGAKLRSPHSTEAFRTRARALRAGLTGFKATVVTRVGVAE